MSAAFLDKKRTKKQLAAIAKRVEAVIGHLDDVGNDGITSSVQENALFMKKRLITVHAILHEERQKLL